MSEVPSLNEETWYRSGPPLPQALVRCRHGMDPVCQCVKRLNIDKNLPITEREASIIAASFELTRLKRLNVQDDIRHELLNQIIRIEESKKDIYIEIYKIVYGSLLPKEPIEDPKPDPSPPSKTQEQPYYFWIELILTLVALMSAILYCWLYGTQLNTF
jgi:hypothetical protein